MKKHPILIGALCIAACAFLFTSWVGSTLLSHPFDVEEAAYLHIYPNDNIDDVRSKITEETGATSFFGFNIVSNFYGIDTNLKPGRYEITSDMTMLDLLRRLKNHSQTPVKLVLPSVRTMGDLAGFIGHHIMIDSAEVAVCLSDNDYCSSLGYTKETIPALFIPNTYEVWWTLSADDFIARMQKENTAFWNESRTQKQQQMGMSKTDIITLASIVDEETANNGEKPRIAGLYLNRLAKGIPLQSDPTVKFAVGDFKLRRILKKHLDVASPYNTYRNTGLPPGPIRIPSIAGIDAVLNHETHNYIYMCAKEDFSGTHNFAVTYNEHLQNARRYTKALDARGIK